MERTTCCVVGGGPAGMVLGLLLARAGVEVTVLEKHGDFLRDFRGDTVHPTTLELLDELGLGEKFAALPQSRIEQVGLPYANGMVMAGDLRQLRGKYPYIAMVPQWDLLDLLADAGRQEPTFTLRMNTEATGVLTDGGTVTGVRYRTKDGTDGELHADLTIACDGRGSVLRAAAGLSVREWRSPMDVWWFRLPRKETDPRGVVAVVTSRRAVVLLDRGDYWQSATLIAKGTDARMRQGPVGEMLRSTAEHVPWLADRVDALRSWDDVKLLDVRVDRLRKWFVDGLLCIGDAAHAMSPVGGVGINLAVQDAVAAARLLAGPLRQGKPARAQLARVQLRRLLPTVVTQGAQRFIHKRALGPTLRGEVEIATSDRPPLPLRLLNRYPKLRRIPAYAVGRGLLPEHAPAFARRKP